MPTADAAWLEPFSRGLLALADEHQCELVGGDTTRGPLNICITVFGEVLPEKALLRSGARAGDDLYESGSLGDARAALEAIRGTLEMSAGAFAAARLRMEMPQPRVALGQALRGVATSAIDVSDGLLGDLRHVLRASNVGVRIETAVCRSLMSAASRAGMDVERQLEYVLAGGDDYELLFTAPPSRADAVKEASRMSATPVTRIGRIESEPGIRLVDEHGTLLDRGYASFDHFAG
jgi:thiamine-monophosphate kinase